MNSHSPLFKKKNRISSNLSYLNTTFRRDPTRTLTLRNRFISDINRRFKELKRIIKISIVDRDCFGLLPQNTFPLSSLRLHFDASTMRQFDFPTSEGKVKAFMEWLREQGDKGILSVTERVGREITARDAWMNTYIDSSYRQGIFRAQLEMKKIGIPNAERPINYAFFQSIHADRVGLIYTRTFESLKTVTQVMNSQIQQRIADGLTTGLAKGIAEGKHPLTIAKELVKDVNNRVDMIGITRARTIARTEIIRAHHVASINEYREAGIAGVTVQAEWGTAGDMDVCEICQELEARSHNKPFTLDEIEGMIPQHPNCLIESSRISAKGVTATSKRWYDGNILIITTAGGKNLTCTPNHPILTRGGFVPASSLNIGSDIICCIPGNLDSTICCNDKNMPTTIKEVSESFGRSCKVPAMKMKTSSPDFHGDGIGSNITIIRANSKLRDKINISFFKHRPKHFFKIGNIRQILLSFYSSFTKAIKSLFTSFCCFMRCLNLIFSLFIRHLTPFEFFRFTLCSEGDISLFKSFLYNIPANIKLFRQFQNTFTPQIKLSDLIFIKNKSSRIAGSKSSFDDNSLNNLMSNIKFFSYLSNELAGNVFLDNIIDIRCSHFFGHVYNLQTKTGFYIAEGIITHNCRCVAIPYIENL